MKICILGACGTFMSGVYILAKQLGHECVAIDAQAYSPIKDLLDKHKLPITLGYSLQEFPKDADLYLIGNALTRGNLVVEWIINERKNYMSGAEWLKTYVLKNYKHIIAVAGTHGKTTTTSLITHILQKLDYNPGFLIGGFNEFLGTNARLGGSAKEFFVVEADEYDSAFFDKRSKFLHFAPTHAIITSIEFDHADIYNSIDDIVKSFAHWLRIIPEKSHIFYNKDYQVLDRLIAKSCFSQTQSFSVHTPADWMLAGEAKEKFQNNEQSFSVTMPIFGQHNRLNALSSFALLVNLGIKPEEIIKHFKSFRTTKRRQEIMGKLKGASWYDDFAHHPTAIKKTLQAFREEKMQNGGKLIALLDIGTNSLKKGFFSEDLPASCEDADVLCVFVREGISWNPRTLAWKNKNVLFFTQTREMWYKTLEIANEYDHVILLSNTNAFSAIKERFTRWEKSSDDDFDDLVTQGD